MPNPLEVGGPPQAPLQDQQSPMQGVPQGQPQSPLQGGQAPQMAPPPAPSHQQTVAALRHFGAIQNEVGNLLRNPNLGKTDIKSQIIDGVTKLVSEQIISPAQAVIQLAGVPTDPIEQRKWLQQQMNIAMHASQTVLDDHRAGVPGTHDMVAEAAHTYDPDQHMTTMAGLMGHYKSSKRK